MNVLSISLDKQIAEFDKKEPSSGVLERQKEYAKYLSRYFIIVRTNRKIPPNRKVLTDNIFVFPTSSWNKLFFIFDAYKIGKKICKEERINCVTTQDPYTSGLVGYLLKRRCNVSLNVQVHGDTINNNYFIRERLINSLLNKLGKWIIQMADTIRVTTSKEKEKLIKLGIEKEKIWKLPCFINFDRFLSGDGTKIRRRYLDNRFNKLILYAGRISREKHLSSLIRAVPIVTEKYPGCLFLIVGYGPQEKKIKKLTQDLKVIKNVRFVGRIGYKEIPDYFAACDAFVLPSLYEGSPMVLLETGVSAKPIISTPTMGAYDIIIDSETGFIVDFKKPQQIAEKVVWILKNPQLAEKMGENGRKFVLERFAKEKILQHYLKMWQSTLQ